MRPRSVVTMALGLCLALLAAAAPASLAGQEVAEQDAAAIDRRPIEDPLFGVSSVVPEDWRDLGSGTYARGTPPQDLALVAIQTAPASLEQLWPSLLPQFALDEIPEVTGTISAAGFDWQLYQFVVGLGDTTLAVELAMAEDDGATHLVLLQSEPGEFAVLREQVLLPAIEAFGILAPEPTPDPATLGFAVEEVAFPGGSDGVELAGTLTLPPGPGPHPAIVLMSGSGAQDRDESLRPISTIKPFALIADALTSAGVAVLRYDDRGVGASTGDYDGATVTTLAGDGHAALEYLRDRTDVDPTRIGILGHSEGGLYAAMLAAEDSGIAFVVGMAAPAVDGVDLIVSQNEAIAQAAGETEEEIALIMAFAEEAVPLARDGEAKALGASIRDYFGALWDRQSEDDRTVLGDRDTFAQRQVDNLLSAYLSDWYRSILAYDPAPDWERVRAPVLGLFGARDVQVVLDRNEPALRAALEAAGSDFEIVVFPDANHLFQAAETGGLDEYSTLAPRFTAGFLPTLVDWVTAQAGVAG